MKRIENPVVFSATVLGMNPHSEQVKYLLARQRRKVLCGARRSGKTTSLALEIVFEAVRAIHESRPFDQLIVAPSVDQARLLFNAVGKLLRSSPLGALIEHEIHSPFPEMTLVRNGRIFLRAAHDQGRLLRGHTAHRVICDEAAFMQDIVIEEAIGPILADHPDSQLVLASSPDGKGSLFWRLWSAGQETSDDRVCSFTMKTLDNPHIDASYVESQRVELTEAQFAAEYLGQFVDQQGAAFKWDHVRACIDGGEEQATRGARRYRIGWDPARVRDRSGVAVVDVTEKPWRVVHVLDLRGVDYVEQVQRVADLARHFEGAKVVVDQTNESTLVELLRRAGTWCEGVRFTVEKKAELVMSLQLVFERRELVLRPQDRDLLQELRFYEARVTAAGLVRYGAPEGSKVHDDLVTAVALAIHGVGSATHAPPFDEKVLPPFMRGSLPLGFGGPVSGPGGLPDDWGPWGR
jgi:hypothetical protein